MSQTRFMGVALVGLVGLGLVALLAAAFTPLPERIADATAQVLSTQQALADIRAATETAQAQELSTQLASVEIDPAVVAQLETGLHVYEQHCLVCHGDQAQGSTGIPALASGNVAFYSDAELLDIITNGVEGTAMLGFPHLPHEEREAVVQVVRNVELLTEGASVQQVALAIAQQEVLGTPEPVPVESELADAPPEVLERGAHLFLDECTVCHGYLGEGEGEVPALNSAVIAHQTDEELLDTIYWGIDDSEMMPYMHLTHEEREALVAVLRNLDIMEQYVPQALRAPAQPTTIPVADSASAEASANAGAEQLLRTGINVYLDHCSTCHGSEGEGGGETPALESRSIERKTDEELLEIVYLGLDGTAMLGFPQIPPDERRAVVAVIRNMGVLSGEVSVQEAALSLDTQVQQKPADEDASAAQPAVTPPPVPTAAPTSAPQAATESETIVVTDDLLDLGVEVYLDHCSTCHGDAGEGQGETPELESRSIERKTDEELLEIVYLGLEGTAMLGFPQLTPEERRAVVAVMRNIDVLD